ncbi:MAG: cell division protein ftsK, segregation ATPase FtsK/SpoIIIE, family [Candidatus Parcubacteria bacterium]|jgi:S-DNA-T family DNA segregation ATPase FtsK/SpoIIIE
MGRKKKIDIEKEEKIRHLKEETLETIWAIVFFLTSVFLLLASLNKGGVVGEKIYAGFSFLFGIGYFLIPLVLITLGISFLKEIRNNFATPKVIASVILFVSGLAFVSLLSTKGGAVGSIIAKPLLGMFDFWASLFFTLGLIIISVIVMLDAKIKFTRKPKEEILSNEPAKEAKVFTETNDIKTNIPLENDSKNPPEKPEPKPEPVKKPDLEEDEDISPKKSSGLVFFPGSVSGKEFTPPPLSLLEKDSGKPGVGDIKANANIIKRTLFNFGIEVEMDEVSIGPSVTRYALKPAEGVKINKIVGLQNDLSLALAAHPLRIEAPIPGKSLVGIEIPNTQKTKVGLGSMFDNAQFNNMEKPLLVCLGKGITGQAVFSDVAKMPHMLIAGATGSGKSVTIHAILTSLLYRNSPDDLKFIMIDPKRVELTLYNKIPHLLTNVITDAKKAILSLKWAAKEMERRYEILEKYAVRDIKSYQDSVVKPAIDSVKNKVIDADQMPPAMPYIVVIIDELADIMQAYPRELESAIVRLAQMSRAVGIHLILSTQRPSVNVITGLIKANVPTRLALQVASQIDSRTILDMPGAEKLLGAGDMLFMSGDMAKPIRVQSAFISEGEVKKVVEWLANNYEGGASDLKLEEQSGVASIIDSLDGGGSNEDLDDMFEEAKAAVVAAGKGSTSYIQRKLGVGYARAARLMDQLEEQGVVGPENGSKPREVLVGRSTESGLNEYTPEDNQKALNQM